MRKPSKAHARVEETAPAEEQSPESFPRHLKTPMGMMLFIDKPAWDTILAETTLPAHCHTYNSAEEEQFSVPSISVDDKLFLVLENDEIQSKLCKLFPARK